MTKFVERAQKSNFRSRSFSGAILLGVLPVFAISYVLLVLPFLPDDGKGRVDPVVA